VLILITIKEFLKDNILITDGSMGTYYSQITGKATTLSELANKTEPEVIKKIHTEYINAGAKLIRTNTFSVNTSVLNTDLHEVRDLIHKAYDIALEACKDRDVYIAADIGPIPHRMNRDQVKITDEYKYIVDAFFEKGADIFNFETFGTPEDLFEITAYIKDKNPEAFVITQFVLTQNGLTRGGISAESLLNRLKDNKNIDAFGFNCGIGPTHLFSVIRNITKKIDFANSITAVLPNAGYPEIVNERTVFSQNADYFSDIMLDFKALGVKILGGCCGTTPLHIAKLTEKLGKNPSKKVFDFKPDYPKTISTKQVENKFAEKLRRNEFVTAVELDPPFDNNIDKIIECARILKENNVDIITISDSPLARVRADSIISAAKIKREVGIDTLPHICCRDRNIISIKASLLGAYSEGIRNVLAVTGDPIAASEKIEIKSVFNLNSFKLMELISEMNKNVFADDGFKIGGALNLNAANKDIEVERMYKKIAAGASFFLTQPIFDDETIEYLSKIKKPDGVKILAGIMPVVSYRNCQFLNNEVPGISIPEKYVNMFNPDMTKEEAQKTGIEIAVEIASRVKQFADGLYLMTPFNRVGMIAEIMNRIK